MKDRLRKRLGRIVTGALCGLITPFLACPAQAQSGPVIRLVVPYAAGGGTDILARHLAESLSGELKLSVIVDNRPGAGGNLGASAVARAAADGNTLLVGDLALAVNPSLFRKMPFDPLVDLQPIARVASAPLVLVVAASFSGNTVGDLVTQARTHPGRYSFASAGNGNPPHIAGELFRLSTGLDLVHVPYKGVGPALNDLLGGQVTLLFTGISSTRQHIEAGRLKALAVTGSVRAATLPGVPTMAEAGLPEVEVSSWWGLFGPAGLTTEVSRTLAGATQRALGQAALRDRLTGLNIDAGFADAQSMRQTLEAETVRWAKVIRSANITPE